MLHPLSHSNNWISTHCNFILILGWIIGSLHSAFYALEIRILQFDWGGESYYDCRAPKWSRLESQIFQSLFFLFAFVLPFMFQTFSYGSITRRLLKDKQMNNQMALRRTKETNNTKVPLLR